MNPLKEKFKQVFDRGCATGCGELLGGDVTKNLDKDVQDVLDMIPDEIDGYLEYNLALYDVRKALKGK